MKVAMELLVRTAMNMLRTRVHAVPSSAEVMVNPSRKLSVKVDQFRDFFRIFSDRISATCR
jgi:hypothetical protein